MISTQLSDISQKFEAGLFAPSSKSTGRSKKVQSRSRVTLLTNSDWNAPTAFVHNVLVSTVSTQASSLFCRNRPGIRETLSNKKIPLLKVKKNEKLPNCCSENSCEKHQHLSIVLFPVKSNRSKPPSGPFSIWRTAPIKTNVYQGGSAQAAQPDTKSSAANSSLTNTVSFVLQG